jgi:gas vesicle protein
MMSMVGPVEYAVLLVGLVAAGIWGAVSALIFALRRRNEVQPENQRTSNDPQ